MRLGGNELFASLLSREINCTTFERTRKTFFAVAEKKVFFRIDSQRRRFEKKVCRILFSVRFPTKVRISRRIDMKTLEINKMN